MQSDEEIGKVAQATPVIVGRALEIFMANLVEVSLLEAKNKASKELLLHMLNRQLKTLNNLIS